MPRLNARQFLVTFLCLAIGLSVTAARGDKHSINFFGEAYAHQMPFNFEQYLRVPHKDDINMTAEYMQLLQMGNSLGYAFYEEWHNIRQSLNDKAVNVQCLQQLSALMLGVGKNDLSAIKFIDSWGKIPAGILKGHLMEMGNFDECVDLNKQLAENNIIIGKYCFANLPLDKVLPALKFFPLQIAVCMPNACAADEFDLYYKILLKRVLNLNFGANEKLIDNNSCVLKEKPPLTGTDWFAITVLIILAVLMLLSSMYDYFCRANKVSPNTLLSAFSVPNNLHQLLRIDANADSPHVIHCLNGLRCLSLIWVVAGHTMQNIAMSPNVNNLDILTWARTAFSMLFQSAVFAVDSFFLISGLLVATLALRQMDRNNGNLSIGMMYLHRFLRLTPTLAVAVLVHATIYPQFANGPLWPFFGHIFSKCTETWWATLLYVQNYTNPSRMCIGHAWYLAVDMQLYILSPLFLIPLWKWKRKGVAVVVIIGLLLMACLFTTELINKYEVHVSGILLPSGDVMHKTYFPTHTRTTPWIIGLLFGYYLRSCKGRRTLLPKWAIAMGWLLSCALIATVIFSFYPKAQRNAAPITILEESFYWTFGRVAWSLALCWIIFTCINGYAGPINSFLSSPLWQPLSKLSYCIYLWHIMIISFNTGRQKTNPYFSNYDFTLKFWSNFGWSLIWGTVMYLASEAPVMHIEKVLLPRGGKKP